MSKATEKKMDELHGALAQSLLTMTQVREVTKTDKEGAPYVETVDPSPAALAVAAKFLKDNSIFSTPEQSGAMDELKSQLARRRPSAKDIKDAMSAIGNGLLN